MENGIVCDDRDCATVTAVAMVYLLYYCHHTHMSDRQAGRQPTYHNFWKMGNVLNDQHDPQTIIEWCNSSAIHSIYRPCSDHAVHTINYFLRMVPFFFFFLLLFLWSFAFVFWNALPLAILRTHTHAHVRINKQNSIKLNDENTIWFVPIFQSNTQVVIVICDCYSHVDVFGFFFLFFFFALSMCKCVKYLSDLIFVRVHMLIWLFHF